MADGDEHTVSLHTNNGKTGYKVVKFNVMPNEPFNKIQESVLKMYKIPQGTPDGKVDFSDGTLVAAGIFKGADSTGTPQTTTEVFFDNEIINQDLYLTCYDAATGEKLNYYFELEQINLSEDQALAAIVKNLRNEQ